MAQLYTVSTKLALALAAAFITFQIYQAAMLPIHSGEAYLYDRFVRPTTRQVLASELPNRDVLYSLLEKRSVGIFHVSPFSVRLPGLLFGILYLWSVWQLARSILGSGWLYLGAVVLAGAAALRWGWFVRADGAGTALALELCAVWLAVSCRYARTNENFVSVLLASPPDSVARRHSDFTDPKGPLLAPGSHIPQGNSGRGSCVVRYLKRNHNLNNMNLNLAGACLGLSVAARLDFAIPAAVLALGFLALLGWTDWVDRILIPAVVVTLVFLVLPLTHAHASEEIGPELTGVQATHLQSALQMLRANAGTDRIRIGAVPSVEPIVNFYRAQHRATTWERAARNYRSEDFDYYLLPAAEGNWAEWLHLVVLYRDADFLLARRSYAPM